MADAGLRAHRVTVLALGFVVAVIAVTLTMRPGSGVVVWPLALYNGPLLVAALVAGLVGIVSSSTAAHRGYPRWSGAGALAVLGVFLCTICMGALQFVSMGSFDAGGTRVGNVTWRNANVAADSSTVPMLYRCDRFGVVCTPCRDAPRSPKVVWGMPHPIPEGETCPTGATSGSPR